ncbi:MAG: hypothetical protein HY067_19865 [Betaproteobacteria bacterium]|nr:hypothetical protein [Betaproteobacteria bacterium]
MDTAEKRIAGDCYYMRLLAQADVGIERRGARGVMQRRLFLRLQGQERVLVCQKRM